MQENQSLFSLSIDPIAKLHLNDVAKWARFLAIVGIILLALGLIATVMGASLLTNATGMKFFANGQLSDESANGLRTAMMISAIIMGLIVFFPLLFLLQFANRMKRALAGNQQDDLNIAFQNLKKYFRYLGIIVIIFIVIYSLGFFLAIMGRTVTT